MKDSDKNIACLQWHQKQADLHPCTCGTDSSHGPLMPDIDDNGRTVLACTTCGYEQDAAPLLDTIRPLWSHDRLKTLREAATVIGRVSFHSEAMFIDDAIAWLCEQLGDIHLEYHEHDGWGLSCCYIEKWGPWEEWLYARLLGDVLAEAVLQIRNGVQHHGKGIGLGTSVTGVKRV